MTQMKTAKKLIFMILVVAFAFIFAFVPMTTICGYNCSLNNAVEDYEDDQAKGSYKDFEDVYDYLY